MQNHQNISRSFTFSSYAADAVMALALALNETYADYPSMNVNLHRALETVVFNGDSVHELILQILYIMFTKLILLTGQSGI